MPLSVEITEKKLWWLVTSSEGEYYVSRFQYPSIHEIDLAFPDVWGTEIVEGYGMRIYHTDYVIEPKWEVFDSKKEAIRAGQNLLKHLKNE